MREIKFRAKSGTQWRYGDLYHNEHGELMIYEPKTSGRTLDGKAVDGWRIKVEPETVGQYTGLKDCEGREIYEGDVVRYENCICLVVYNSARFASFALRKDRWAFDHYFGEAFEASECHVIGNVHDNPELLKREP